MDCTGGRSGMCESTMHMAEVCADLGVQNVSGSITVYLREKYPRDSAC